ncbi:MAG TPA: hypothetical protein VFW92_02585 [Candidatus Limnocylindrales bacterium]|nr:hypothetical protein [Candidatus Limnocylindrales bacterium]
MTERLTARLTERPIERKAEGVTERKTWAALGAALAVGLAGLASVCAFLMPPQPGSDTGLVGTLLFLSLFVPLILALSSMGLLIAWRSPGHPVGPLLIGAAVCLGLAFGGGTYAGLSAARGAPPLAGAAVADWCGSWAAALGLALLGVFVPLLFPTGHFLSPRWRRLALILVAIIVVGSMATAFLPGPLGNETSFDNPFGITALGPLLASLSTAFNAVAPLAFGSGLLCLVLRYRRGTTRERDQIKLFAYPAAVAVVALLVSLSGIPGLSDPAWEAALLAMTGIPVAIAMAIVRHGLFDIDRLISRTLAYGLLTAFLLVLYGLVTLAIQPLVQRLTGASDLAVAAATLAAAVAFQLLRRRIQDSVDRRFDRTRYDAERTVAAFGSRLRDEVELAALGTNLVSTVAQTLQPARVGLWLRRVA